MTARHRVYRLLLWNVAVTVVLFAIAWIVGFVGIRRSVPYAVFVATFSYFFWAYGAIGMATTDAIMALLSTATYIPPPLAVLALSRAQVQKDLVMSGVHCIATGAANTLVCAIFLKVSHRSIRFFVSGALLGSIVAVAVVLPPSVVPSTHASDIVLGWAAAPANGIFYLLDVTVPVAEHRIEMSARQTVRLVGWYVLVFAMTFGTLAVAIGRGMRQRAVRPADSQT